MCKLVFMWFPNNQYNGLMAPDWVNGWKRGEDGAVDYSAYGGDYGKGVNVLDMAANAENFGTLAYFYQYIKE